MDRATDDIIPAGQCPDMATLRGQIDRIDRSLVGLIAERLTYIARAAEIKQVRHAVHDQARIDDVIAKVLAASRKVGVPDRLAEAVWRELIAQSIALEFERFDALKAG